MAEDRLRRHPLVSPKGAPAAMLELNGFGVAFGDRIILSEVTFSIPDRGTVVLLGPAGTGKSTLLRTLAGLSAATPSFRSWGEACYCGSQLGSVDHPELVAQSTRLMMASVIENVLVNRPECHQLSEFAQREVALCLLKRAGLSALSDKLDQPVVTLPLAIQRQIAILRSAAANPGVLCIDEPTTGLNEDDSIRLLHYMRDEATRRALLVVLHNQEHARILGGEAILLAGGCVQEKQLIPRIFDMPQSAPMREFAKNGTCNVASPGARPEELSDASIQPKPLPKAARHYAGSASAPRGFLWLKKEMLAGTPAPGVYFDMEYDLKALRHVGVTTLVTLTETPLDENRLAPFGLKSIWEPIPDMNAPTIEQGVRLCKIVDRLLAQQEVIAVHCRAGLGRTGTVLAAHLIWEGHSALNALEAVRNIEPRWVQSQAQIDFLEHFAQVAAKNHSNPRKDGK
ncbi:MAG TPA: ATP-binding cassette domain-containing protein [Gallionellaceae bacterium]